MANLNPLSEINLSKTVPPQKKDAGKISNVAFEISVPTNVPDNFQLVFQNYYTANIVIVQDIGTGPKVLLENKKLMECASNEAEACLWHSIPGSQLFSKGLVRGKAIKIYLFQSCDIWNKIDLRNIKVVFQRSVAEGSPRPGSVAVHDSAIQTNTNNTTTSASSLSSLILSDFKILTEAARVQSSMKLPPESYYNQADDHKRSSRRKDKRSKDLRKSMGNYDGSLPMN
jgi:hypothetical protein